MKEKQVTMLNLWHAVQGLFIQAYIKGLFTWGRKILKGGATSCWVYMQKFWSVWCPSMQRRVEKELKMMDNKNKNAICALLFTGLNNQQSYHKYQLEKMKWSAFIAMTSHCLPLVLGSSKQGQFIQSGTDPHRFPPFYGNWSHFS